VVDTLSRRTHKVHVVAINMYRNDLKDQITVTINLDQQYIKTKEILQ
jgi:hypothetical protein